MCDAKPRTCREWQVALKGIAEGHEPTDPEVATSARVHALRCTYCWEAFGIASAEARRHGTRLFPPMFERAIADAECTVRRPWNFN